MFTNPEKGDFSFRSKENANKIGFKEFNMTFGVIGDEWRRVAENYTYHDPLARTNEYPLFGLESFEEGENTYFIKRISRNKNPYRLKVGITTEKAYNGNHSFKIQHLDNYQKYLLTFKTLFINGSIEFTTMLLLSNESQYKFDFGIGQNIIVKYEKIFLHTSKGPILGYYSYDKWFKLGIKANIGDIIQRTNQPSCKLIINDEEVPINITKNNFKSINSIVITSEGSGVSFIDDINSETNQYIEPYFGNCLVPKEKQNSKLGVGAIVGIVIGIIAFIAIVAIIIFFVLKNKKKNVPSSEVEF